MSWANIVQAEPARKDVPVLQAHLNAKSMAVVDTNALIAGLQLHTLAEQLVTVPEVLAELRDAKSRQALDALPCRLHTREPSEESLTAGAGLHRTPLWKQSGLQQVWKWALFNAGLGSGFGFAEACVVSAAVLSSGATHSVSVLPILSFK